MPIASLGMWLEDSGLESHLVGGDFAKLLIWQATYYQLFFKQFDIDWQDIFIDRSRLELIAKGLRAGLINYPLLICTPETLSDSEKDWTEAQYFFNKLFLPLLNGPRSIFGNPLKPLKVPTGESYSHLTQVDCVANYLPVSLEDFDLEKFASDPKQEMLRIAMLKKSAARVSPKKIDLVFTNCNWESPRGSAVLNKKGQMVKIDGSFQSLIINQIKFLEPTPAIILFSQMYYTDQLEAKWHAWEWLMAIIHNPEAPENHQVSAAGVSVSPEFRWSSYYPEHDGAGLSFRLAF